MKKISILAIAMMLAATTLAQGLLPVRGGRNNRGRNAQQQNAAAQQAELPAKDATSFNWVNTPSDLILEAYCDRVGKTPLIDPNCPKNVMITLKSPKDQDLTNEEYLEAIRTVLEMNGIHIEDYKDSFVRALPRKDVRKEGIPLIMDADAKLEDRVNVVSMMIPFENMSVEDAQKVLEGFKSNTGLLISFERTNKILVTDTEQNIKRMLEIAQAIDVATPATEQAFVRQIKNAVAADIKTVLDQIVQDSQKQQEEQKQPAARLLGQPQQQPMRGGLRRGRDNQPAAPTSTESMLMSISDADRGIIRGRVTIVAEERSNKLVVITSKSNMDFFDKVIEALDVETTPDTVVKVYRLKYAEAEDVSDMLNDLIGSTSTSKSSSKNQNQNAAKGKGDNLTRGGTRSSVTVTKTTNQRSGEAKAGELTKDNTVVLADKRINGIVVMTDKELVPTVESIIESMDIKLSQVLIETVIIEVTLGDDLQTGVDWVRLGDRTVNKSTRRGTDGLPLALYTDGAGNVKKQQDVGDQFTVGDTLWEKLGSNVVDTVTTLGDRAGFWTTEGALQTMLGGGGGSGTAVLENMLNAGTNVVNVTPIGSGLNYFFKSDKLNLGAVIQASKTDSRARYLASPIVMTVDNKEATIDATEARKFFNGYETSSSYSTYLRTPKYDSKDIGIKIKVKPKINPNGTVMLNVEEEYSQLGSGQTILVDDGGQATIDTALTRKMTADVLLENMETVVLSGLTEKYNQDKETGIPILKDIPWIGKWLFGSVSQTESRKELLIFMTPYVMDDGAMAQLEAARRKKALSDPRPWDDNGWSASKLADPVARKEILRRLEDEAKKQDEERQTKIATEKWKVDRAKKLKQLTKEERDLWLKMHKEELEKEEKEEQAKELEEKMLDDKSQEELRKIADGMRERKLAEAEAELAKAAAETASQNERGKMDAEKAKKEEEAKNAAEAPEAKPETAASVLSDIDAMAEEK